MQSCKHKLLLGLLSVMLLLNCGEKVPVKELALAKLEISRAVSVRAKQYAPQELEEAEKKLLESHEFLKEDTLDKCKKAAVESREKALEAYNKSVPMLAKDTLDIAKQSLEQADAAYASVLAESEYGQAEESYNAANEMYDNKEYYPCYEKALEADGLAKDARNTAVGKKEILSKSISEVKAVLADAEKYNSSIHAKDLVDTANENLKVAEDSLETLELKKGFSAMETAGMNADEAYLTSIRETAREKAGEAEKLYSDAENSDGAELAKDELKASKEALDQSKEQFEASEYKDSILSSEESIKLSNTVIGSMKNLANEKITGAELVYHQAENSEGASAAAVQLKGAKDALEKSRSLYEDSKYKEAIASASESERLSNIVINTRGKGSAVSSSSSGLSGSSASEDYFIYKVRYIPERRDCLWRIAEKYYSNPFLWKNIYKANTDKIQNPDLIWPDMLIKVPKMGKKSTVKQEETAEPAKEKEAPTAESTAVETMPLQKKSEGTQPSSEVSQPEESASVKEVPEQEPVKEESTSDEKSDNAISPSKQEDQVMPSAETESENSEGVENSSDYSGDETDIDAPSSDQEPDEIMPEEPEAPADEN